jgi:hypothetical protein
LKMDAAYTSEMLATSPMSKRCNIPKQNQHQLKILSLICTQRSEHEGVVICLLYCSIWTVIKNDKHPQTCNWLQYQIYGIQDNIYEPRQSVTFETKYSDSSPDHVTNTQIYPDP